MKYEIITSDDTYDIIDAGNPYEACIKLITPQLQDNKAIANIFSVTCLETGEETEIKSSTLISIMHTSNHVESEDELGLTKVGNRWIREDSE
jgi:hypothetical protein